MMNFVKSSNGITVFGNNGEVSMFPNGTFEFYCASQVKDGNFESFPFLKNEKIYEGLNYDKDTKLVALNGVKFNTTISSIIKKFIWNKDDKSIKNFYNFIKGASKISIAFLNHYIKDETFESLFSSDAMCIQMHENEIIKNITNFGASEDGILLDVIIKIGKDGEIVFTGAAPKQDYNFSEEYQTTFAFWIDYLMSQQSFNDIDSFFDNMNKKLDIIYNIKQAMLDMKNPLLSKILSESVKFVNKNEEEFEDIF